MPNYTIVNGELYHVGVKGMKWGVRKKQYISTGAAKRRAFGAQKKAFGKAVDDARASGSSKKLGSYRSAVNAGTKARKESIANDKAHNKQIRSEKKAANPNRKRELMIAGAAIAGTAVAAYGAHKLSNLVKDRIFQNHMRKGNSAVEHFIDNFDAKPGDIFERMKDMSEGTYDRYGRSATKAVSAIISDNYSRGRVDWKRVASYLR